MATAYVRGRALRPDDLAAWMSAARPYLPTTASGRILDLGAGTGRFSTALAQASPAGVIACEPSAAMREICRRSCGPETAVVAGTAEALPFTDNTFDAVWASQVIHHITDLPAFARELHRILKPGGTFLLRGGFGPVTGLPLYRYFPLAWPATTVHPPLAEITTLLATVGLHQVAHTQVPQLYATNGAELLRKVRTRSLSPLAALPDPSFQAGLHHLETDLTHGRLPSPLTERLDLVVFRR